MSDLPARVNSSIVCMSRPSSSDNHAPLNMRSVGWDDALRERLGRLQTFPFRFLVLYMLTEPIATIRGCTLHQLGDGIPVLSV